MLLGHKTSWWGLLCSLILLGWTVLGLAIYSVSPDRWLYWLAW